MSGYVMEEGLASGPFPAGPGSGTGAHASPTSATVGTLDSKYAVLRAVMENTDARLAYLDREFNFVAVNSTYARGCGMTEAEIVGTNYFDLFPNEESREIFRRVRDGHEVVEFRAKPHGFPGQPWRGVTYWDWRLTPVDDERGQLQGLALSLVDVTHAVRSKRLSDALNQLSEAVHATFDFDKIIRTVLPELASAIPCETVVVALRSSSGEWRIVDAYGLALDMRGLSLADIDVPTMTQCITEGAPLVVSREDDPRLTTGFAGAQRLKSFMLAPLALSDGTGVVGFGYLSGPGAFGEESLDFARKAADTLSLALRNSQLFEAERHARRQAKRELETTKLLLEAADALTAPTELRARASRLAEILVEMTSHSRSVVATYDDKRHELTVLAVAGVGAAEPDRRVPIDDMSPSLHAVIAERRTLVADLDQLGEEERGRAAAEFDVHKALYAPLVQRDRVVGVLILDDPGERGDFPDAEVDLVEAIASQAAVATENARLYEMEHHIADRLQAALLALPDELPGMAFAHAYHSATEQARVGGDFYDLFELNHGRVGVVIGDVAGKGLDAAVLTSMVKNTIRAHATERGKTPQQILQLTNDVIYKATPTESFVTVFFGILDCRDGRFVYSNAGHTAPAILRPDGHVGRMPATGPILGAFAESQCGEAEARVELGEVVFLYSDGLTEARREGVLYGEGRLESCLTKLVGHSPDRVVAAVLREISDYTSDRLDDDLAILALTLAPLGPEVPRQQRLAL